MIFLSLKRKQVQSTAGFTSKAQCSHILLAVYMIQSNLCECTLWSLCCDWAHLSCLSQSNSYGLYFLSQRLFNKHPSVWFANTFPSHTQLPNEQWFLRFAPENWKICLAALSFGALSLDPGADGSTTEFETTASLTEIKIHRWKKSQEGSQPSFSHKSERGFPILFVEIKNWNPISPSWSGLPACLYLLLLSLLVWCVCLEWKIFPASHPEPLLCSVCQTLFYQHRFLSGPQWFTIRIVLFFVRDCDWKALLSS